MPHLRDLPPLLLPSPRRITLSGERVVVTLPANLKSDISDPSTPPSAFLGPSPDSRSWLTAALDPRASDHSQGYRLLIAPAAPFIQVSAPTGRGLRHAVATLAQLLSQYGEHLPCLDLRDEPAFATRGVMLDISRDKVPTMASLRQAIDLFASLKFNHLQLYTEHTFAYAGHEDAWRDASPITPDEARELDACCRARGIDLVPNQNCFGHLAHWLGLPRYAHLAETHGDFKFLEWSRSGPFSLCPTDPRSIVFVRELLGQLLPCFTSGLVNIGCDETFDVGSGCSAAEVARRGRPAVYFEFVNQIGDAVRALGKRPMMWADIALSHPESLRLFPKDAIGLAWGYEPDADFTRWCEVLREHGIEAWVCPGTSSWRSITGRTTERNANISGAAADGSAHGATGFLVTDWGDSGHHQHWPIAVAALAQAAQAAWNPDGVAGAGVGGTGVPPVSAAASLHALADSALQLGPWLDALGDIDLEIRQANAIRNSSALFNDLHRHATAKPVAGTLKDWHAVADRLDSLGASIPGCLAASMPLPHQELQHTLATARLAVEHAIATRTPDSPLPLATVPFAHRARLADLARQVLAEHRRLWTRRNRPGGLERSCSHYARLIERIDSSSAPSEPRP